MDAGLWKDVENSALAQDFLQDFFVVLALCNTAVLSRKTQDAQDGLWLSSCECISLLPAYTYIHYSLGSWQQHPRDSLLHMHLSVLVAGQRCTSTTAGSSILLLTMGGSIIYPSVRLGSMCAPLIVALGMEYS